MKILPVSLIREADAYTIKNEPIDDIDLMERAASACFHWLEKKLDKDQKIMVFCGSGNNGGDGLAIARILLQNGFRPEVFLLGGPEKMTTSCRINYERINSMHVVHLLQHMQGMKEGKNEKLPTIAENDVVIDAIFGSGLTRYPDEFSADVINQINSSGAMVVSIDVPSGLFCDVTTKTQNKPAVIRADYTLTFSPPKLAFFFSENDDFVGDWQLIDIGILQEFIDSTAVHNFMPGKDEIAQILKKRNKFAHKGNFGHALLICGSTGKMGAAVLSARACLRSGAGLVTVHLPKSGITILQTAVAEAMVSIDKDDDNFTAAPDLSNYSSIAIGPGIGTSAKTANAVKLLIQNSKTPIVFDADAINLLAENKTWLGFIPKSSVFTPHPKEFERLAGKSSDDFERNQMQRDFSIKYQCYIVLKGACSAITTPDGRCFFNTTGNPGMATGGSGDVLTGIIAGLMAQGYSSLESCLLGVYIHGLSGDIALVAQGYEALIANDIILNLGKSFQTLYGKF
ncbi:MAG: NAD(P)H-hydrate dehydratase [Bacteroidota bacterium]